MGDNTPIGRTLKTEFDKLLPVLKIGLYISNILYDCRGIIGDAIHYNPRTFAKLSQNDYVFFDTVINGTYDMTGYQVIHILAQPRQIKKLISKINRTIIKETDEELQLTKQLENTTIEFPAVDIEKLNITSNKLVADTPKGPIQAALTYLPKEPETIEEDIWTWGKAFEEYGFPNNTYTTALEHVATTLHKINEKLKQYSAIPALLSQTGRLPKIYSLTIPLEHFYSMLQKHEPNVKALAELVSEVQKLYTLRKILLVRYDENPYKDLIEKVFEIKKKIEEYNSLQMTVITNFSPSERRIEFHMSTSGYDVPKYAPNIDWGVYEVSIYVSTRNITPIRALWFANEIVVEMKTHLSIDWTPQYKELVYIKKAAEEIKKPEFRKTLAEFTARAIEDIKPKVFTTLTAKGISPEIIKKVDEELDKFKQKALLKLLNYH